VSEAGRIAAFFDLDRTLLLVNSGRLWLESERRHGRIGVWQMIQATFYLIGYKFNAVDMERVMVKALSTVRGVEEEEVRRRTHEWYQAEVAQTVAPGARPALESHRAQGHPLVLLTASSLYESEIASRQLELDAYLATRYEVVDGHFTGDVVRPLCYGPGKVVHAERWAVDNDVDLDRSYFYTDSITDLAMLERVGEPRIVQPDPRLRRLARKRGWEILDWS